MMSILTNMKWNNSDSWPTRRNILKHIGGIGITSAAFSGTSIAQPSSENSSKKDSDLPDVNRLKKSERQNLIGRIMSDPHAQKIQSELRVDGWSPGINDGIYRSIEPPSKKPYNVAVIPFNGPDHTETEQRNLAWVEKRYADSLDLPHVFGHKAESESSSDISKNSTSWSTESYIPDNEFIKYITSRNEVGTNDIIDPPPPGGCYCRLRMKECSETNWTCVMAYVLAVPATAGLCYACYQSAGWLTQACFGCLGIASGDLALIDSCETIDCEVWYECVDDTIIPDEYPAACE